MERLKTEKDEFWLKLLKQYIISQKLVVIIGDPSEDFMKKMGEEEKQRVEKQAACLGEKGLKEKSLCLENALSQNNVSFFLLLLYIHMKLNPIKNMAYLI